MLKVTLIGQGEIGQALSKTISSTNAQVTTWDRHPEKNISHQSLEECVVHADMVLLCIPTSGIRSLLSQLQSFLPSQTGVVIVAKGLEKDTHLTSYEVAQSVLGENHPVGLLYGPLIAEELMNKQLGVGVIATTSQVLAENVQNIFQGDQIRVEHIADPYTVSLLGVLKNIYALTIGIAEGLKWGNNAKGWLTVQVMNEMREIINRLQGNPSLITSTAGLGDFIATGFSCYSKNAYVGQELAIGQSKTESEGLLALPSLFARLNSFDGLPLLQALQRISENQEPAKEVFTDLITH